MDTAVVIQLVVLIILLALSAFFSSSETALTSANEVKLKALSEKGNKNAARVLSILENPGKMLSTILIGNNIVNISTTSLATVLAIKIFGNAFVGACTAVLTVLVIIFGEIVPKTAAAAHAESVSMAFSPFVKALMWLLTPIIFIIDKLSGLIFKLLHISGGKNGNGISETELKTYVEYGHEGGAIETEEREMIMNVFEFGDSLAKEIMIPRIEVTMVDVEADYAKLQSTFRSTMYSRLPVYETDKDHIIGSITLKDFFLIGDPEGFVLRDHLRDIYYTYETKKTSDLLNEMRESANNVAVVLDEYGSAVGMITLEDLLEEIVGEIRDEYDSEENELLREVKDGTYDIAGSMKLDDINDALHIQLESEDYDSIGGLLMEHLDHIPKKDEVVTLQDGTVITARVVNKNRIMRVALTLPEKTDKEETEE
ncbi:MAG: hemolysin family protein [Lachnospiraceae bacterium]|nr:hemolysin family protein [Lachnospiraceae bacterium]